MRLRIALVVVVVGLLFASPSVACELQTGVGKQLAPYGSNGEILGPGMVSVGCRFHHKYDIEGFWFAEQRVPMYHDFTLKAYGGIAVSRVWEFKRRWFGTPVLSAGVFLKDSDRCDFNGDEDCNRRAPMAVNYIWKFELTWTDWRLQILHISNDGMDWGPEAKNLGQNAAQLVYRFR